MEATGVDTTAIGREIERCIDELRRGRLTEPSLQRLLGLVAQNGPQRQDVLYLQANTTSPVSQVVGMRIIEGGEISDGPSDPDDWPYQTVLDAVRDGWRIIKFPEIAQSMDESRTYGLGYEFVLEKLRWP
jgi:hypothetical protein